MKSNCYLVGKTRDEFIEVVDDVNALLLGFIVHFGLDNVVVLENIGGSWLMRSCG